MALDQKKKNKRDDLVADLNMQIRDKQDLLARVSAQKDVELAKIQDELDELLLKRDGLEGLK